MEALLIMDSEKKIIKHYVRNQADKDSAHSVEKYKKIGDLALKARSTIRDLDPMVTLLILKT